MTREQIMRIFKDYSVTHGGLTEVADAILALPIDVPGDEELLNKAVDHNRTGKYTTVDYYSTGIVEGATWMRDEIIKRNRP